LIKHLKLNGKAKLVWLLRRRKNYAWLLRRRKNYAWLLRRRKNYALKNLKSQKRIKQTPHKNRNKSLDNNNFKPTNTENLLGFRFNPDNLLDFRFNPDNVSGFRFNPDNLLDFRFNPDNLIGLIRMIF